MYPIKRSNNSTLFVGNTKFTLGRPKIANFNSVKTFKITNSQTFISANISSFTVGCNSEILNLYHLLVKQTVVEYHYIKNYMNNSCDI